MFCLFYLYFNCNWYPWILCTCSDIPLGSERTPASLCGSLSWASLTYIEMNIVFSKYTKPMARLHKLGEGFKDPSYGKIPLRGGGGGGYPPFLLTFFR